MNAFEVVIVAVGSLLIGMIWADRRGRCRSRHLPTLTDLQEMENRIMSKIGDHAAKQDANLKRIGASVDGLVSDVKALNDKIAQLQNSPGEITPEDQALLDDIDARTTALADRLQQLDDATAPQPPPPADDGGATPPTPV